MTETNSPASSSRLTHEVRISFEPNRRLELTNINDRFAVLLGAKFNSPAIEMQKDEERSPNLPSSSFDVQHAHIKVSVGNPKHFDGGDQALSEFTRLFDSYVMELTMKNFSPIIKATVENPLQNSR